MKYKINDQIPSRKVKDCYFFLFYDNSLIFIDDDVGKLVLKNLESEKSKEELLAILSKEYIDVDKQILFDDLENFISELSSLDVIKIKE